MLHIHVATLHTSLLKVNRNVEFVMNNFLNVKAKKAAMDSAGNEIPCPAKSQQGRAYSPRVGLISDDDDPLLRLPG